ncbi:STY0301 family protein [Azohydromonas aeria]|uniref:STY0301 family protein n=1 Tax=Azohydromonas aeria TaxID=2590212 RepID=UPI0012FA5096|nr:STY0301 family protein [Azohydromonas aeria]
MRIFSYCAALTMLVASQPGRADVRIECPTRIFMDSGQVALKDLPTGFVVSTPKSSFLLYSMTVYNGPPEKKSSMAPNLDVRSRDSGWKFEGDFPEGKWISCDYAEGLIRLAKRLDEPTEQCRGILEQKGNPKLPHGVFRCR